MGQYMNLTNMLESIALTLISTMITIGVISSYISPETYYWLYAEDKLAEWIDFYSFLIAGLFFIWRFFHIYQNKNAHKVSKYSLLLCGILLIFFAGEEISWGQRIIGFESSTFFKQYHCHQYTNFHCLYLGGFLGIGNTGDWFNVSMNFISILYLIILPIVLKYSQKAENFINCTYLPTPKTNHSVVFTFLFILTCISKITIWDNSEPLQVIATFIFCLVTINPKNKHIYK